MLNNYSYMDSESSAILGLVDSYLVWHNENQPARGHKQYHPSAFGRCLRLMQYQRYEEMGLIKGEHKNIDPFVSRIFGNGHSMHDRWRGYFEALGILRGYWLCTNPMCSLYDNDGNIIKYDLNDLKSNWDTLISKRRIYGKEHLQGCLKPKRCVCGWEKFHYEEIEVVDKELNFAGHADIILDFTNFDPAKMDIKDNLLFKTDNIPNGIVVVDLKTINHFDYQDVAKGVPHNYYIIQLMIYANILQCDYGVLIYENKNNQKACAFKIGKSSDYLYPIVKKQARLMNEMIGVEKNGQILNLLPPPRPDKNSKECEYCQYKTHCHASPIWQDPKLNEARIEFYGDLL